MEPLKYKYTQNNVDFFMCQLNSSQCSTADVSESKNPISNCESCVKFCDPSKK